MARILVVDDEIEIRQLLRQLLEREGYEVIEAPDGDVAVRLFRENPADLVITDIIMPEKEGIKTIFELRHDYPGVKIIAISGGSRVEPQAYLDTAEAFGAIRSFVKPFSTREMIEAVRELLAQ